jgi:acyl carrier protein
MENKVLEIVSNILQVDISSISLDTSMDNTTKWDSLKQMQIVIAIEEEFEVQISDDDLIEANSIHKLVSSINRS